MGELNQIKPYDTPMNNVTVRITPCYVGDKVRWELRIHGPGYAPCVLSQCTWSDVTRYVNQLTEIHGQALDVVYCLE